MNEIWKILEITGPKKYLERLKIKKIFVIREINEGYYCLTVSKDVSATKSLDIVCEELIKFNDVTVKEVTDIQSQISFLVRLEGLLGRNDELSHHLEKMGEAISEILLP